MSEAISDKPVKESLGDRLLRSNSLVFTYLRSIVSSQCAGWADMFIGFVFFAWIGFEPLTATMIGAFCGGVINCILNYRFTFRAQGVDWRAVIVKYALVWIGSMLLNSYGTQRVYSLISDMTWLENIGFRPDGYYAAARIFTSLMVSWFWNFVLQRYFVYRSVWVDRPIVRVMKAAGFKKSKNE
ncbi:MAG: GtrA family protein [Muribaculaceae bacterium]|nr:GtrA family protein [Muribaculaceae bacterium]